MGSHPQAGRVDEVGEERESFPLYRLLRVRPRW